jgi:hypothetical protein
MCSACSGDYCGGYEDQDGLDPEIDLRSKGAFLRAIPTPDGAADRPLIRCARRKQHGLLRAVFDFFRWPSEPEACASPNPAEGDYDIFVTPTAIVEIHRIGCRKSVQRQINRSGRPNHGRDDCSEAAGTVKARPSLLRRVANFYQTSPLARLFPARTRAGRAIPLVLRALAAGAAVVGSVWLFFR